MLRDQGKQAYPKSEMANRRDDGRWQRDLGELRVRDGREERACLA